MLRVTLQSSRYLTAALASVHLAAAVTLIPLELGLDAKAALAVAIVASVAYTLWRYTLLRSRLSVLAIELTDRESATVQFTDGSWRDARVLGTSYVSPLLTVINLRLPAHRFALHSIIVPDNIDPDDFRRLRVILRWSYPKQQAPAAAR
jgi:toxin CptA